MSRTVRTVLRLVGAALIIFGVAANLPTGWAVASVGAGLAGLIAGGCGG
jgi:hypothetical protein